MPSNHFPPSYRVGRLIMLGLMAFVVVVVVAVLAVTRAPVRIWDAEYGVWRGMQVRFENIF